MAHLAITILLWLAVAAAVIVMIIAPVFAVGLLRERRRFVARFDAVRRHIDTPLRPRDGDR